MTPVISLSYPAIAASLEIFSAPLRRPIQELLGPATGGSAKVLIISQCSGLSTAREAPVVKISQTLVCLRLNSAILEMAKRFTYQSRDRRFSSTSRSNMREIL